MCGIAGIFKVNGVAPPEETILRKMLYRLRHRGPDENGIFLGPGIGFAHSRLSIIDLSTGQQPMSNESGSLWVVFNGEIFNYIELRNDLIARGHRFRTGSDTEVILHMYEEEGAGALSRFNGQFAIAIWDREKKELFLARDRVGICPLFYARVGDTLVFASEIKAILADEKIERKLDPTGLDDIFTFWFPVGDRTAFKGIRELPPAHFLRIGREDAEPVRYWDLPESCDPVGEHPEKYYADTLRELLVDATRLRLRADVPVGAYLSGGLDSSVIASIVRNFTENELQTFSVRFEDPEFDEGPKQKIMTEYLGTTHSDVVCGGSDISRLFDDVVCHAESPIVRTAPVPLFILSRLARENSVKVVLTGEGADEILAGYDIFKEGMLRRFMGAMPGSVYRPLLLKRLYPYLKNSPTQWVDFAKTFFGAPADPFGEEFVSHAPRWKTTSMGKLFFSDGLRERLGDSKPEDRIMRVMDGCGRRRNLDPLAWMQEIEFKTLLPRYLLAAQGDRMLMGNSVEGRFPFLDHRVVEFCFRIPARYRMWGLDEKHILRKSMGRFIPSSVGRAVKQPYRAPDAASFSDGLLVREMMSQESIYEAGYFDPRKVQKLLEKFRRGNILGFKDNMAFVGMLSTQILHSRFVADIPSGEMPAGEVRIYRNPV